MPIVHTWEDNKLLVTRYTGTVSGKELAQSALELSADVRFDELRYVVGDWREVEHLDMEKKDIQVLVAYIDALCLTNPRIRNATLVKSTGGDKPNKGDDLVLFYRSRTGEVVWETEIFTSEEEAREWLGVQH
jgi:hypothetical protein